MRSASGQPNSYGRIETFQSVLLFHPYQQVSTISVRQRISKIERQRERKGGRGGLLCTADSWLIKMNCLVKTLKVLAKRILRSICNLDSFQFVFPLLQSIMMTLLTAKSPRCITQTGPVLNLLCLCVCVFVYACV